MGVYIPYRRLPSEYQEVEYIQSSGSGNSGQYIDTGFVPDPYYFKLYLDFKSRINYGAANINGRPQYNFASYMDYTVYETFFGTSISPHIRYNITQGVRYKYTLEANNGTATLTDENGTVLQTITYSGTLQATGAYNFGIFRRQEQSQYTDYSDGTLYACKMYTTNDVLVRDFVPCYRKSDNEIGLYDLVNDQFYANSGTGTFTKGPILVQKELQNAYIGEVYEYSYDFIGKTISQISNDGWQGTSGWTNTTDGLYRNAWNNPLYIQPSGMGNALSDANKITMKMGYYVTKGSGTRDILCILSNTFGYVEPRFGLYCGGGSGNNMVINAGTQSTFTYSYTGSTVFTEVRDFVNKTLTISSTDGNSITPSTFSLTDSMIATLKTYTYINILQNGTYSKMQSISITIE